MSNTDDREGPLLRVPQERAGVRITVRSTGARVTSRRGAPASFAKEKLVDPYSGKGTRVM